MKTRQPRSRSVKIPKPLAAQEHGLFFGLLRREGLPLPETEVRFHETRRWRFDFAWWRAVPGTCDPTRYVPFVALEVEGGAYSRGRHTRGKGFIADMAKYNEAAVRGWKVIRVTPQQLSTLETVALIKRALTP